MKKMLLCLAAGLLAVTGAVLADNASAYFGWNPSTGLEVVHGSLVSGGVSPVVTGSTGCGTLTAKAGGASTGTVTIGTFATSCVITITFPSAAPNGWVCGFKDLTTPADSVTQASTSTTACASSAATMVTGDKLLYDAHGF
jgi:hypothetical protein